MPYIKPNANESGAYSSPQSNYAYGLIEITDEQALLVTFYNGFVNINVENEVVTITPNIEAWEEWKANNPKPEIEATTDEVLDTLLGVNTNE